MYVFSFHSFCEIPTVGSIELKGLLRNGFIAYYAQFFFSTFAVWWDRKLLKGLFSLGNVMC